MATRGDGTGRGPPALLRKLPALFAAEHERIFGFGIRRTNRRR